MQAQKEWRQKTQENVKKLEQANIHYNKMQSRLESLKNIAERYEGYGNSIRRIMEKKGDRVRHSWCGSRPDPGEKAVRNGNRDSL